MKDRKEFLASVYAKRDAELVKRTKYKRRMISGLSAAAACLVLTVGLVQMDMLDFMGTAAEGSFDGAAVESITENEALSNSSMEKVEDFTAEDSLREEEAAPGQAAPTKDIYDIVTDDSQAQYICLPCFTIVEQGDGEAATTHGSGIDDVEKVQAWVDRLAEQGKVITEGQMMLGDFILEEISCIVTIEIEPQQLEVYYLTGEVGWYE